MKPIWKRTAALGVVCVEMSCLAVSTDSAGNSYQQIPERNIFGLKPFIQPQATREVVTPALPKLLLTGITTLFQDKLAMLKIQLPTKQGQPPAEDSLILAEGQRQSGVEVLSINEKSGTVRVNNSGTVMSLTFDKDGVKPASSPTAAPARGQVVAVPTGAAFAQPVNPPSNQNAAVMPPAPRFGAGRNLRLPNTATPATAPAPVANQVIPPPSPAAMGAQAAAAQSQAGTIAKPLSPEEEAILKALEGKNPQQPAPQ